MATATAVKPSDKKAKVYEGSKDPKRAAGLLRQDFAARHGAALGGAEGPRRQGAEIDRRARHLAFTSK